MKHANIIDSCQDELILASDVVIYTYEGIDSQIFGLVLQSIATPNNRNCAHVLIDNGKVSHKLLSIYFISFLGCNDIISIYCLFRIYQLIQNICHQNNFKYYKTKGNPTLPYMPHSFHASKKCICDGVHQPLLWENRNTLFLFLFTSLGVLMACA